VADVVQVLVSADRRWRVEIRRDGLCRVFDRGFLRATCRRHQLAARLAALGVDLVDLVDG